MLETILKLYAMYMATGVTSPVPHLFGPPGCGKSTVVQKVADLVGVNLHVINVSRISPLELEGVQMPAGEGEQLALRLLHATFWTQLKDGDILLLDEFLRGFPEVYNGLLDILTSRQVGGYVLPKVFIIAASNTTVSYDKALEDRLMHLPVKDPRTNKTAKSNLGWLIIDQLGLMPEMKSSIELTEVLDNEVLPMYEVLDALKAKSSSPSILKGSSPRKLIGQALLREVQSPDLAALISANNRRAWTEGKVQFMFLLSGKDAAAFPSYKEKAEKLRKQAADKLTEIQAQNLELNLQLVEMESIRYEKGPVDEPVVDDDVAQFL